MGSVSVKVAVTLAKLPTTTTTRLLANLGLVSSLPDLALTSSNQLQCGSSNLKQSLSQLTYSCGSLLPNSQLTPCIISHASPILQTLKLHITHDQALQLALARPGSEETN